MFSFNLFLSKFFSQNLQKICFGCSTEKTEKQINASFTLIFSLKRKPFSLINKELFKEKKISRT